MPTASNSTCCAIRARAHPLKYLKGLAAIVEAKAGKLYAGTIIESIEERDDGTVVVSTAGGKVVARAVVVATNSPIVDRFVLHTKMAPYRSYAMAFSLRKGAIRMPCTGTRWIPITMCGCSRAWIDGTPLNAPAVSPLVKHDIEDKP
ncbi:FAD-dependent oxidoreductase [Bradyrhizobium paxllaeri]|uniref:FAD-dependent oxidoreductase n=1 Tax=Bradyrhizobium paxllaeri TaxID=190148 RepID=UPI0008105398|nr:FAD-dependent oxidoreductase [Bradyrhizobium paxllaeri]